MRYVFLSYDIPDRSEAAKHANAMRRQLHRFAVRVNKSDWIMREDDIPHNLLNDMRIWGANWHAAPFAEDAAAALNQMVVAALERDIVELTRRLAGSIADAETQLEGEGEKSRDLRLKHYQRRCRAALRRGELFLASAKKAAEYLGFDIEDVSFSGAATQANALQNGAHVRAALYAAATANLHDTTAKAAAQGDELPVYALADAMEEQGEDAEPLRMAFAS